MPVAVSKLHLEMFRNSKLSPSLSGQFGAVAARNRTPVVTRLFIAVPVLEHQHLPLPARDLCHCVVLVTWEDQRVPAVELVSMELAIGLERLGGGGVVRWWRGEVVEWWSGELVEWRGGGVVGWWGGLVV